MRVNLEKRIPVWQERGLISAEVGEKILSFEEQTGSRNWVGFGIAGIGVTALMTGLVSLLAAHWEEISASLKLLLYFALQLTLGGLFLRAERNHGVWREASLALFALSFFLGIGLIGQIYNLSGPWWRTLSFWLVLALGPTSFAESKFLPRLWCVTVLAASLLWVIEADMPPSEFGRVCWWLAVPFFLAFLGFHGGEGGVVRSHFRNALVVIGIGSVVILSSMFGSFLWSEGQLPLRDDREVWFIGVPWIVALFAASASIRRRPAPEAARCLTAALIVTSAVWLTVPVLFPLKLLFPGLVLNRVLGAAGFLLVWSLAAAAAARADRRRLFDLASFVIALRLIVVYFEVFGSLTTTGLGLVLSGVVILGVGAAWTRLRGAVHRFARGAP